jgi:hypothetical protein
MKTIVNGSVLPKPIAALEAMSKFEGPANGIRLNANEVAKIMMNSNSDAMLAAYIFLLKSE